MTKFAIPEAALDTHIGILGRTGSGKTFTARGMVERLLDAQRQVVIVDPTGAWWGLRSAFAIPIFGGEHGDVEITDQSGEAVAETILAHHSSAIVDLSGLARQSGAGMRRFMAAFIARLKDRDRGALWLVLDEADEFLPQVLQPEMTRLFGDLKWIVRRGRVAGWRVMMITQRPQDIAKSVLTQIGTLVAHRLTAPQDRKAVEEWVKGHADPEEAKAVLSSLAGLQRGEAWVWSPENELLERAIMPPIRSFDSGATPDADSGAIAQPELASIDMAAIRATLEGRDLKAKPLNDLPAKDISDEILKRDRRIAELEAAQDGWTVERGVGQQQIDELQNVIAGYQRAFQAQSALISDIQWPTVERRDGTMPHEPLVIHPVVSVPSPPAPQPARQPAPARDGSIPPRWQRILDGIAWAERLLGRASVERNIVAWLAETSPKSSGYQNDLGAMRTANLIEYPAKGCVQLAAAGHNLALAPQTPPTKRALLDAIGERLEPRHRRILYALWNANKDMTRGDLADRIDVSASSSGFQNDLGRLRTLGLVDYPAQGWVGLGGLLK